MMGARTIKRPAFACLSAFWLKVIALLCMICDHVGFTGIASFWWLRLLGRVAFPIYVFLLVEGFFFTKSRARYALRLFGFALLSEVPFDLMCSLGSSTVSWGSQNVMFELLLGLLLLWALDFLRAKLLEPYRDSKTGERVWRTALWLMLAAGATALCCFIAERSGLDYGSYGMLLVAAMYLLRGSLVITAVSEAAVFSLIMPRYERQIPFFGGSITTGFYGWGILSMIPIALYNGKAGPRSKALQYAFYLAYPLHMLILALMART